MDKHTGGRPWLTDEQKTRRKEYIVHKLEPYLMTGLSVNKALREAKIANSEFYKYLSQDRLFGENIQRFRNYISILVNSALVNHLMDIAKRQMGYEQPQGLSKDDVDFLCWFALHSNLTSGEYGGRNKNDSFDPEMEVQKVKRIIQETTANAISPS